MPAGGADVFGKLNVVENVHVNQPDEHRIGGS